VPSSIRGLLVDIDGVLTVGWEPLDGVAAVDREARRGRRY